MKKKYISPVADTVTFQIQDIITASLDIFSEAEIPGVRIDEII